MTVLVIMINYLSYHDFIKKGRFQVLKLIDSQYVLGFQGLQKFKNLI